MILKFAIVCPSIRTGVHRKQFDLSIQDAMCLATQFRGYKYTLYICEWHIMAIARDTNTRFQNQVTVDTYM